MNVETTSTAPPAQPPTMTARRRYHRRRFFVNLVAVAAGGAASVFGPRTVVAPSWAQGDDASSSGTSSSKAPRGLPPGETDVDEFLRTGMVPNPMGVSGQAGKSRPVTGVVLREGSEVTRDSRTGSVLAELLLQPSVSSSSGGDVVPVVASFASPWPLATGSVFDVECRDPATGDGAFLQVTQPQKDDSVLLSDSFLMGQLAAPTGRFSLYGAPTDVRVRDSRTVVTPSSSTSFSSDDDSGAGAPHYKMLDVSFSIVSQSTQTELPRRALVVATVPRGTKQAVMLVTSGAAGRWANKGVAEAARKVAESFAAVPAPPTKLRIRQARRELRS
jgi:hypothetical protein